MLNVKNNCKWSLLVPSSVGVRITPENGQPVYCSDTFRLQATSAETNAASIVSYLGYSTLVLTAFVEGSPIADFIRTDLRSRGMSFEAKNVPQGGPWGFRHQFNIADSGFGSRGPRVWNDRSGEVGRTLDASDFDLDRIFVTEGVGVVHITGLFAALSESTGRLCLAIARKARETGTAVSFDLNYRASFWKGREKELSVLFSEIASCADILMGNEEDFQLCLGISGPAAGGKEIKSKIDNFREMISGAKLLYPGAKIFGTTLREVCDASTHLWGAILSIGDDWQIIEPREIRVLDRIGGGDGFVGGLLYSVLRGFDNEKTAKFAWASGALVTTLLTDYALPCDEAQIMTIAEGNARVVR